MVGTSVNRTNPRRLRDSAGCSRDADAQAKRNSISESAPNVIGRDVRATPAELVVPRWRGRAGILWERRLITPPAAQGVR